MNTWPFPLAPLPPYQPGTPLPFNPDNGYASAGPDEGQAARHRMPQVSFPSGRVRPVPVLNQSVLTCRLLVAALFVL